MKEKETCIRWRYVTAVLSFLGLFTSFCIRGGISVAIVSMTSQPPEDGVQLSTNFSNTSGLVDEENTVFDWDAQIQGIVLGGFFWGYIIPQVISGILAKKYGSKNVVLVGGILATAGNLLGPVAANTHVYLLIATRVLCGLGLSVYTPCCHMIIASWCHPNERSRMLAFIYSGCQFGIAASFVLTGYLCKAFPIDGWKWSFYIFGLASGVWLVLWFFLVFSTPDDNPWISDKERIYIETGLSNSNSKSEQLPIPWTSIGKSMPVWAIMVNGFGQGWGFYTLLTQLPRYMKTILGFDMSQSGLYASLPYLATIIVGYISSIVADYLIKLKIFQIGTVRKIFTLAGMLPCGLSLLAITFAKNDSILIYSMLVVGVAMFGCLHSGSHVNHIDLAPNFAGILQGIVNTATTISGILSPYVIGVILGIAQGAAQWNIVFYISSGMLLGSVCVYTMFANGQVQLWNNSELCSNLNPKNKSFNDCKSDKI